MPITRPSVQVDEVRRMQLAIDPGGTTGWALGYLHRTLMGLSWRPVDYGQIGKVEYDPREEGYELVAKKLMGILGQASKTNRVPDCEVILEDFILLGKPAGYGHSAQRDGLSPVRIGSWVKALVAMSNDVDLVIQTPSQIAQWSATRMKRMGIKCRGPHAWDAMAHLMVRNRVLSADLVVGRE